jgi:hypothetical protein
LLLVADAARAFLIFVTEEIYLGQLFDAHIYRRRITIYEHSIKMSRIFFFQALRMLSQYHYATIQMIKRMSPESGNHNHVPQNSTKIFVDMLENCFKVAASIIRQA